MLTLSFYRLAWTKFHLTFERSQEQRSYCISSRNKAYGDACVYVVKDNDEEPEVKDFGSHAHVRTFGKLHVLHMYLPRRSIVFRLENGKPKHVCEWQDMVKIMETQLDNIDSDSAHKTLFYNGFEGLVKLLKEEIANCDHENDQW